MNGIRSLALAALVATTLGAQTIRLKTRDLKPEADRQAYMAQPLKRRSGQSHYLVQFAGPVTAAGFDELRARGMTVTGYLPDAALMIAAPDDFSLQGLPVRWVGRLEDRDKISPLIAASSRTARGAHAYVVEFHADVPMDEARAMVREHGLRLIENPYLGPHHLLVRAWFGQVSRLASWDEVAYIFPAVREIASGARVHACAGAIVQQTAVAQYATVGQGWGPTSPDALVLGYVFAHLTDQLPPAASQAEILRALNEWAKHVQLSWVAGADPQARRTVNILFATGVHGDPYAFDGPGGVMAHTFYPGPPNPEPIAGDMHLDDAERWQVGADMDLFSVAQHEAGHALGLAHSDNPNDVMYPYYRFGKHLSGGDIATVRSLYPVRDDAPTPTPAAPLMLTVLSPAAVFTTSEASIAASGTTAGGTGTVQVAWGSDSGQAGVAVGSASWLIAGIPLNVGANTITITAIDEAARTVSQNISVTLQQPAPPSPQPPPAPPAPPPPQPPVSSTDKTPPSLLITYPASSIVATSLASITLKGLATDNIGVTSVAWIGSAGISGMATGTMNWRALDIPLLRGNNNITIKAFDAAGNYGWRSMTVVRR